MKPTLLIQNIGQCVTPEVIREVIQQFEEIGCDEFIFVPIKPDIAHLDELAEIVG